MDDDRDYGGASSSHLPCLGNPALVPHVHWQVNQDALSTFPGMHAEPQHLLGNTIMTPCGSSPSASAFAMPGLPVAPCAPLPLPAPSGVHQPLLVSGDNAMSPSVHSPLAPPAFAMPGLPEPPVLGDHAMSPSVHSPLAPFAFAMPGLPEPPVLGDHAMSPCVHSPLAPPAFAMPVLPEPPVLGDHAMSPFVHSPFGLAYQSQPVVGDHSMAASANPLAESSAGSPEPLPAGFPQLPSPDSDFGPFPVELFAKGALPKQEAQQPTMFCDPVHPSQSVHHQDLEVHTRWCPPVISWFINPINYRYKYNKP